MDIVRVASLAVALPLAGCAYGSIETTEATSAAVTADGRRHLRANVNGLLGGGLVLTDDVAGTVSVGGDGVVVFPNAIDSGTAYAVTITDPPIGPHQVCTVGAGDGVVGEDDPVVNVTCAAPTFTVGGHVSGVSAVGLVIEDNGAGPIALSTDGSFRFATALPTGASYLVSVAQQPSGQTCQIYFAEGVIASDDVENVEVVCADAKRPLAGSVRNLEDGIVLLANGDDVLAVHGSGRFTMPAPVAIGAAYDLVIAEPPAGATCTVTGGQGKMTSDPADVVVDCTTSTPPSETVAVE